MKYEHMPSACHTVVLVASLSACIAILLALFSDSISYVVMCGLVPLLVGLIRTAWLMEYLRLPASLEIDDTGIAFQKGGKIRNLRWDAVVVMRRSGEFVLDSRSISSSPGLDAGHLYSVDLALYAYPWFLRARRDMMGKIGNRRKPEGETGDASQNKCE